MTNTVKADIEKIVSAKLSWHKLQGKTVLVTGATGFIGSFIIHSLMRKNETDSLGVKILALVRNADTARAAYGEYEKEGSLSFIEQDVCVPLPTDKRADYIIHCASNAAPKEYSLYPVETMKTNFYGTLNLLDYAKAVGAESFLYVSTIEVYGTTHGIDSIDENTYGEIDAMKVRSCYPLSKKGCETLSISYADEYGVNVKIGRLSYIFGPGMKPGDSKIVAVFPKCIADGENIVMKSKGEQLRSYTYVTDAITGLPRRLEIDSVEVREALKDPVTQIVEVIKRTLGQTPPELSADIIENGIVMTGGGSLLKGLPKLISKETGVPVLLVDNPQECVAIGAGKAFELFRDISSDRSIYDNLNN